MIRQNRNHTIQRPNNKKVKEYDNDDKVKAYYYISYDDLIYDSEQNFDEEEEPNLELHEQHEPVTESHEDGGE